MTIANHVIAGILVMGYAVASLFFLRFWRESRDRLFLLFALAFVLLAVDRIVATVVADDALYLIRALAFAMILAAVLDKNRR